MSYSSPPPPPQGWWSQNWKWFVPTLGCVGCVLPLVLFGGCIAAIIGGAATMGKNSPVYTQGLARARANPAVIAQLGEPIEDKGISNVNINTTNGVTTADLTIKIAGPKGAGTLHAVGTARGSTVNFSTLTVSVPGSGSINLLETGQQDSGEPQSSGP